VNAGDFTALVLAGRRGPDDPLARRHGVSHRALLPVAGVPMLLRVLRTLRAAGIARLHVSIDEPDLLDALPEAAAWRREGALRVHASESSPSRSVAAVLAEPAVLPCLVTTADHALLTPAMVQHFLVASRASGADLCVGMVSERVVRAEHPDSPRTYLRLRGEAWSGANLFAFLDERARRAAEFWVRAERHRKQPWRLVASVGPANLLLYALGRLDLAQALERGSRAIGARIRPVAMPQAEAAIDVDHEADLVLAERILRARESGAG
jgi:GTP:adenosylcobinamide-phosphate guanylyltransferase